MYRDLVSSRLSLARCSAVEDLRHSLIVYILHQEDRRIVRDCVVSCGEADGHKDVVAEVAEVVLFK